MKKGIRDTARRLADGAAGVNAATLTAASGCDPSIASQTLSHMKRLGYLVATRDEQGRFVYRAPAPGTRRNPVTVARKPRAQPADPQIVAFAEWLAGRFAPHTVRMYVMAAQKAKRHPEGPAAWLQARLTRATPAATATVYLAAVRAYCTFADIELDDSRLPRGVISRTARVEPLTEAQIVDLFERLRDAPMNVWTIVVLLTYTGARISEITDLRKGGVVMRGKSLALRFVGKGGVERELPVVGRAAEALAYWMTTDDYRQSRAWVFEGSKNQALHPETVRRVLRQIKIDGRRLHPHVFRHTAATLLIEHGVDLPTVRDILGHASIATTGLYAHSTDRSRREALDRLAAGLNARETAEAEEDF